MVRHLLSPVKLTDISVWDPAFAASFDVDPVVAPPRATAGPLDVCLCFRFNACRDPVLWQSSANPDAWVEKDLIEQDFTVNEHPIDLELCFLVDGEEVTSSTVTNSEVGLMGDGSIAYGSTTPYPRTPPPPPPPPQLCSDSCATATSPCSMAECDGCASCGGFCQEACQDYTSDKPWEARCSWGKCKQCSACNGDAEAPGANTEPPTEPPTSAGTEDCQPETCDDSNQSWEQRCTWGKCKGCAQCSCQPEVCDEESSNQSWEQRCTWGKCKGCAECIELIQTQGADRWSESLLL